MTVTVGAGVSVRDNPRAGAIEAAAAAAAALGGVPPDLVLLFASGEHLAAPARTLEEVRTVLEPAELIGCGAGGVLGAGREHESGTGVAVWAASFGGEAEVTAFHVELERDGDDVGLRGLPPLAGARGAIVLPDPYTFPTDALLELLATTAPAVPVLGGLTSASAPGGGSTLFFGDEVVDHGAVGVRLDGVEILPCVSQGATPLGRELTITAAEGNVIHELAGAPALATIEKVLGDLAPRERALISAGLMLGIVIDGGKPEYEQGDFLVRPLAGVDRDSGRVAIGAVVREGQVVRLHARDAKSADADLRRELGVRAEALSGVAPAGVLVFSCNGRGRAMFGVPDHDAGVVANELGGAPAAGFFAAGEIGPVGGRSFLHGFTATIAVFPA
jgi:small ligand-binding sensory domain FIST